MTYAEVLAVQNAGGVCPHCKSPSGHFVICPLINRNTAEAQSAVARNAGRHRAWLLSAREDSNGNRQLIHKD
jgi:hypothetical protein